MVFLILAFLLGNPQLLRAQATEGGASLAATMDRPDWRIELWETVIHYDHPGFANGSAPLGDLNGDGYDDFAITTSTDTTFIFLGGVPFDHEPAYALYGGGSGIDVGDFNSDGLADLVLGRDCGNGGCPEGRGAVLIYYRRASGDPYPENADVVIKGGVNEYVGRYVQARFSSVRALDYDGDGYSDLLTHMRDWREFTDAKAVIYFGGPHMDTEADLEFLMQGDIMWSSYAWEMKIGDFNGDGCDDALISGSTVVDETRMPYWDLFLGDPLGRDAEVDRVLWPQDGWAPQFSYSCVIDINNDGYDDIVDGGKKCLYRTQGDVPVFLGSALLPAKIHPNDSLPNYDPAPLAAQYPWISSNVGDMNGDGTDDCIVGWSMLIMPGLPVYFYFPGGDEYHTSLGYTAVSPEDYVSLGGFPIGDVNGDGYGDMVELGFASSIPGAKNNRFLIYLGAKQLSTGIAHTPLASELAFTISPNPLDKRHGAITISAEGLKPGSARLTIIDLLGREVASRLLTVTSNQLLHTFDCGIDAAGTYTVVLSQGYNHISRQLVIH